jgi:cardiolipin synthase
VSIALLDGGDSAYPRMLQALGQARRRVHLEIYAFEPTGIGATFTTALSSAAARGVKVVVVIDGWGSVLGGNTVATTLRASGCEVRIHNRLRLALVGRFTRNHRKLLLVDDEVAFIGGINIGDENVTDPSRPGWADLALELRGPVCAHLGRRLRRERAVPAEAREAGVRVWLAGLGQGWQLRRRYLSLFASATTRIDLAHGYFLPEHRVVRALVAAARRGVQVELLLSGASDVPFVRTATRRLYRRLLKAGVHIHEWRGSVLHAKVCCVDSRALLLGSFNLDPWSLTNLETLVTVTEKPVVRDAQAWVARHLAIAHEVTELEMSGVWQRWFFDPLGQFVASVVQAVSARIRRAWRRSSRAGK